MGSSCLRLSVLRDSNRTHNGSVYMVVHCTQAERKARQQAVQSHPGLRKNRAVDLTTMGAHLRSSCAKNLARFLVRSAQPGKSLKTLGTIHSGTAALRKPDFQESGEKQDESRKRSNKILRCRHIKTLPDYHSENARTLS